MENSNESERVLQWSRTGKNHLSDSIEYSGIFILLRKEEYIVFVLSLIEA